MHWFKNLITYRLTTVLDWNNDALQTQLAGYQYSPCSQIEIGKIGWIEPIAEKPALFFTDGRKILLIANKEEKILPVQVINHELGQRIKKLNANNKTRLSKTERQTLKDNVIADLLPRAFSKNQQIHLCIDTQTNLIHIDSASRKKAEDILALLRKTLGSLPVIPLAYAHSPSNIIQEWISNNQIPHALTLLDEIEFKSAEGKGVIRYKNEELDNPQIHAYLSSGKRIAKLALEWDEQISFIFVEDGALKRIKYNEILQTKNNDIPQEDYAQRFDADFILMMDALSKLNNALLTLFGEQQNLS